MDPKGLSFLNPLQFNDKVSPSFDHYGDYQQYRQNVAIWDVIVSIAAPRGAPTIINQLTEQAQVTAKTLIRSELTSEAGVTCLLCEIDKKFSHDTIALLHKNISNFFDYQFDKSLLVKEFVAVFHSRLDKIRNLDMNGELEGYLLLKQANLDSHHRNLVVGAAAGDYSFQALATSFKNTFRLEGISPALINTTQSRGHPFFISATNNSGNRARRNFGVKVDSRMSLSDSHMFYTYLNTNNLNDVSSAIIDSGSCGSVVGRETLDEAMRQLDIDELKAEQICQRKHCSDPSNNPMKKICAVRVPLVCMMQAGDQPMKFYV